jgi:hypothetical protein
MILKKPSLADPQKLISFLAGQRVEIKGTLPFI